MHTELGKNNAFKINNNAVFLSLYSSISKYEHIIPIQNINSDGNLYETIFDPNNFINITDRYAYKELCPPPKLTKYKGKLFKYLSTP